MTKLDLINKVVEDTGMPKNQAEDSVELLIEKIKETLEKGESVILRKFGAFSVHKKNARVGRNPKTGEDAEISARSVVRFKAGKHFKEAVNK
ncbi:MAG: HU family DNA-binding protein [Nitrospinota bacterium]